ncbi:LuxR C-terminal-related transcriptional regulator [Austwickia sp. TVS 96-490-7B]|uniref:response regulator transcription factor n=1 Tax=Austwickia sp. TVS 96-490-7B TaxID=2830843 RepID=UPI00351D5AA1
MGFNIVAALSDASDLLATVQELRPDLVVTDVRMPPTFTVEGLRAAVELRGAFPDLPIVALSQYAEPGLAGELLESGGGMGIGYLLKDRVADVEEFSDTLRRVARGATVLDPDVIKRMLPRRRDPLASLSEREMEVLALIAEGKSNMATAKELVVSEETIVKHVGSILTKLDLPSNGDAHRRVLAVLAYLRNAGDL